MNNYSTEEQLKDLKKQNDEIMTQIKEDKEQREERRNQFASDLRFIAIVWLVCGIVACATRFYVSMLSDPTIKHNPTKGEIAEALQKYYGIEIDVSDRLEDKKDVEKVDADEK